MTPITAVKASLDLPHSKKGFDINSPRLQSPAASGRSTPVNLFDDGSRIPSAKTKEQLSQEAKELFEKERGNEKPHIHLVGKYFVFANSIFLTTNPFQLIRQLRAM